MMNFSQSLIRFLSTLELEIEGCVICVTILVSLTGVYLGI